MACLVLSSVSAAYTHSSPTTTCLKQTALSLPPIPSPGRLPLSSVASLASTCLLTLSSPGFVTFRRGGGNQSTNHIHQAPSIININNNNNNNIDSNARDEYDDDHHIFYRHRTMATIITSIETMVMTMTMMMMVMKMMTMLMTMMTLNLVLVLVVVLLVNVDTMEHTEQNNTVILDTAGRRHGETQASSSGLVDISVLYTLPTDRRWCECTSGTDLLRQLYVLPHIKVADQTFHLTQSQYTDTGSTIPSTDPITPGA